MSARHIVATRRGNVSLGEKRSGAGGSWGGGYPIMDPAAIPPPGFSNQQRAGVLVTQHALALDTQILTTAGWKTMGTLAAGDTVYAEDGSPTRVLRASEIFHSPCFEVSFSDGSTITATGDHLWRVWDAHGHSCTRVSGSAWKTLSTDELIEGDSVPHLRGKNRWRVRCDAVLQSPEAELPIDPYIFGYWLGDGTASNPEITVGDRDVQHLRDEISRAGYRIVSEKWKESDLGSGWVVRFANDAAHMDGIESRLKRLGVLRNKHIPDVYLMASPAQRRALLAGLLDSDGCASTQPAVSFTAKGERLATQVHELARSLGVRATLRKPSRADRCFTVAWTPTFNPFRMERKAIRTEARDPEAVRGRRTDLMSITGIRPVPTVPTRCIAVEHESHVFLAGRTFTPTHNSLLQVDVVFTALRIISNNIIKMGDLWAYKNDVSPDNIPFKRFVRDQPSILTDTFGGGDLGGRGGSMMQCTGRDKTVWSLALFGEAFWYVLERDSRVRPACLEILHPAFMEVKEGPKGPTFVYGTGMDKQELDRDDVIYIPFKSMPQSRRSLSPITYAGVAGALAMAAYEFGSTWFSQGASPSFILSTDAKLGQEEVQRIAQKFTVEHSGLGAAHLPLVLDNGLKAEKVMSSPDEAQYLHTLEYARNVIASWFGLPPTLLGNALERQTPAPAHTAEEETQKFLQHTLSGYMVPLEEAHSGLLAHGVRATFNENALAKPDAQFLAALITSLRQAQVGTVNDLRTRYLGWAPLDDPAADQAMAPMASNTAPSQTVPQKQLPAPNSKQSAADDDEKRALVWLTQKIAAYERDAVAAATA